MEKSESIEIKAMLGAIYKKLLELEYQMKHPTGGTSIPAWSALKDLERDAEKIRAELDKK